MSTLRDLRQSRELTLAQVAGATGIDVGNLSRIERGDQFPEKKTALVLSQFYSISIGTLFDSIPSIEPLASGVDQ